jgi:hypothetical protein
MMMMMRQTPECELFEVGMGDVFDGRVSFGNNNRFGAEWNYVKKAKRETDDVSAQLRLRTSTGHRYK